METRPLTPSTPTPSPAPAARRPSRRPERPGFRPEMQRLEPRISLSGLNGITALERCSDNHNETLLRGRRPRRAGR